MSSEATPETPPYEGPEPDVTGRQSAGRPDEEGEPPTARYPDFSSPAVGGETDGPPSLTAGEASIVEAPPEEHPRVPFAEQVGDALRDRRMWLTAVKVAGLAYGAALIAAAAIGYASLVSLSTAMSDAGMASNGPTTIPTERAGGSPGDLLALALLMTSMGFGSLAEARVTVLAITATSTVRFLPLLVPALAALAAWLWLRRRPTVRTAGAAAILATMSGLLFALLVILLPSLVPLKGQASGVVVEARAASPLGFVVAVLLVGATTWWTCSARTRLPRGASAVLAGLAWHLGGTAVVLLIAVALGALIQSPSSAGVLPALAPTAALWSTALALFSGVTFGGAAIGALPGLQTAAGDSYWIFGPEMPWWSALMLVPALLGAVIAALVVHLRGGARGPASLAVTGGAWAGAGLLLQLGSSLSFTAQLGVFGSVDGWVGPAPTTFLLFALWGVAVGALALWIAPRLAGVAPAGLVAVLAPVGAPQLSPTVTGEGRASAVNSTPEAAQPARRSSRPLSRRAKMGLGLGVALVALAVLAAVALPWLRSTFFGPERVAREYLAALETGEASRAVELSGLTSQNGAGTELLTDSVYRAAEDRPVGAAVEQVSRTGDIARITVSYRRGGEPHTAELTVARTDTSWFIADEWRLLGGLPAEFVAVQTQTGQPTDRRITVNGVEISGATGTAYTVLPGTYTVEVAETPLYVGQTARLVSTEGVDPGVNVLTVVDQPTPSFEAKALAAVQARLEECAARTDADISDDCPFTAAYSGNSSYTDVSYQVTKQPVLDLVSPAESWFGDDWTVRSTTNGEVRVRYSYALFGGTPYRTDQRTSFYVIATLDVSPDGAVSVGSLS